MNTEQLIKEIAQSLSFTPTADQYQVMATFSEFMFHPSSSSAMIIRGSAGTGKTSVASAIVRTMHRLGQRTVLLAPTGRAAKVFSNNSGRASLTIHRKIYRQRTFQGLDTRFNLNDNRHQSTLFIVDEASMIGRGMQLDGEGLFGSGSLLDDLIQYVYSGQNCHLVFIGDSAQLPPVGEMESPALSRMVLEGYGLEIFEATMNEVLRQSADSGILSNATLIRQIIDSDMCYQQEGSGMLGFQFRLQGFPDIQCVSGNDIIEQLTSSYDSVGIDETMIITRSNKRCNIYNQGIRARILDREEALCQGDRLMVVKNKYDKEDLIANGDLMVVRRVRNEVEEHGFRFCDVILEMSDYDNKEVETTVIMDTLTSESAALTHQEQTQLFESVLADYADIPLKPDRMKAVREDKYYGAMQVKFAYAITCHKAQGGQWEHVYLDQGYLTEEMIDADYYHWLYTAITRAKEKLFIIR